MHTYQEDFIRFAIECEVLRFGDFILKSGRRSPYFFNLGLFNTGDRLDRLGGFYAEALLRAETLADVLYGPAYKGIPLACATAIALSRRTGQPIPFAFNRKEAKTHGEGGTIVGAPLRGNILILDDVITAGTSVRESLDIIRATGARPCGVVIALDRQEQGESELSAVEETHRRHGIPVHAIIRLDDIVAYLEHLSLTAELDAIRRYRDSITAPK